MIDNLLSQLNPKVGCTAGGRFRPHTPPLLRLRDSAIIIPGLSCDHRPRLTFLDFA